MLAAVAHNLSHSEAADQAVANAKAKGIVDPAILQKIFSLVMQYGPIAFNLVAAIVNALHPKPAPTPTPPAS